MTIVSFKLLSIISKSRCPLQNVTAHVKSHQDNKIPFELLPYEAQMNVEIYRQSEEVREGTLSIPRMPEFDDQNFQIKINRELLYLNVGATLQRMITGKPKKCLQSKYKWTDTTILKIIFEKSFTTCTDQCGWQYTWKRKNVFEASGK